MRTLHIAVSARRGIAAVALLIGALVLLAVYAPSLGAQHPTAPHAFWGDDADNYVGALIKAFNEDGDEVMNAAAEGGGVVDSNGGWFIYISPTEARTVRLRLIHGSIVRETDPMDVIEGEISTAGLSIQAFRHNVTVAPETLNVRITARLHPTRANRTLEFNVRVDGVAVDPPPRARYVGPRQSTERWLESSSIPLGDGFAVRVIACKRTNDTIIFGLRVDGHDDIIPRKRAFRSSFTHNRWLSSNEISIPMPRDNDDAQRLRGDVGCTAEPLAP